MSKTNGNDAAFGSTAVTEITINQEGVKIEYNSLGRIVKHTTRRGVELNCIMPENWADTAVFQFMDNLKQVTNKL